MNEENSVLTYRELLSKIDQNRESLSREEFVGLSVDVLLARGFDRISEEIYVTREELEDFEHRIQRLQRSFIDFVIAYVLELQK